MPDGLGMLDEQRQRRARSIPTPRNRPRETPVEVIPAPVVHAGADRTSAGNTPVAIPKVPSTPAASAVAEPPVKMSIYLEHRDDMYLEDVARAGKSSRPRVAISRSAIVRLALERLAGTMTNEEIVAELRRRGDAHQGTGRKRR